MTRRRSVDMVAAAADEVQRRLQPLIAAALTKKGYAPASGKGDVIIAFGSGVRGVSTSPPQAAPPPKLHEANVSVGWLPDDEDADFVEGSLVIDAFDGAPKRPEVQSKKIALKTETSGSKNS